MKRSRWWLVDADAVVGFYAGIGVFDFAGVAREYRVDDGTLQTYVATSDHSAMTSKTPMLVLDNLIVNAVEHQGVRSWRSPGSPRTAS